MEMDAKSYKSPKDLDQQNRGNRNNVGGQTVPDLKNQYKAVVIQRVWDQHKDRQIDQWSERESRDKQHTKDN